MFFLLILLTALSEISFASKCEQTMAQIREEIHSSRVPFKSPPPYESRIIVLTREQRAQITALYLKQGRTYEEVLELFSKEMINSKRYYYEPFTPEFIIEMLDSYFALDVKLNTQEKEEIKQLSLKYKKSIATVELEYAKGLMFKKPLYEPLKHGAVIQLLTYAYNLNQTLDQYLNSNHSHKVK
ncbi:MAG: hypothetical protein IPM57_09160 [Oligoflexia bacterium]|nr:hypothetical protein [Oligoflexia bacterium]